MTYAVVTPVRDEAANLGRLGACLAEQTAAPAEWIIVDTGSTDETVTVAHSLADQISFARVVLGREAPKKIERGAPIVRAFEYGIDLLTDRPNVVVKLDADVSLGSDYFERLLGAFDLDAALGIASGSAEELVDGTWRPRYNTGSSVWGAARAYRWECLERVRPLEQRMGWDGVDEIKAKLAGWTTATFDDITFRHHRIEGGRDGSAWKAWAARGRASHYMGYRAWYLLLRSLHHARLEPRALGMVWGYGGAALRRAPSHPDPEIRARLRSEQTVRSLRTRYQDATGVSRR
jgi:glycosyltransferase involved in cell wall biosynthesis